MEYVLKQHVIGSPPLHYGIIDVSGFSLLSVEQQQFVLLYNADLSD